MKGGSEMSSSKFNVASAASLPGKVVRFWERFDAAGYAHDQLPDPEGWMLAAPVSGDVVGRFAIRDDLAAQVALLAKQKPYTHRQALNLMAEGNVLGQCEWPVQSVPMIAVGTIAAIAHKLAPYGGDRRGRRRSTTQVSGGTSAPPSADVASTL